MHDEATDIWIYLCVSTFHTTNSFTKCIARLEPNSRRFNKSAIRLWIAFPWNRINCLCYKASSVLVIITWSIGLVSVNVNIEKVSMTRHWEYLCVDEVTSAAFKNQSSSKTLFYVHKEVNDNQRPITLILKSKLVVMKWKFTFHGNVQCIWSIRTERPTSRATVKRRLHQSRSQFPLCVLLLRASHSNRWTNGKLLFLVRVLCIVWTVNGRPTISLWHVVSRYNDDNLFTQHC